MREHRKVISIVIAVMMILGILPVRFTDPGGSKQVYAAEEPTADELVVEADHGWLVGETVIHYGVYADDIRTHINLPTEGSNGSSISWSSSDERWIAADGTVTQPPFSFAMGSAPVTLTATISKGAATADKTFSLEVYPLYPAEADRVAYAKERLTAEAILSGNSADNVKTRLNLPVETGTSYWRDLSVGGCQIAWLSSDPDVIGVDGTVNRPANGEENASVTLTATLSYGDASDSKTFDFVVTAIEEYPLAISYDGFSNTSLLQFNNASNTVDTTNRSGEAIKALQFNNDRGVGAEAGGSVFTKNKIRFKEDLSFSTAFSYRNPHPNYTTGDGGFTFTLQAAGNTLYSQQLEDESIRPSVSIAFNTNYYSSSGSGQGTYYGYIEKTAVYYNGDYENRVEQDGYLTAGATNDPSAYHCVWIEYNGATEVLEIRFSTNGLRPANSNFKIKDLDLGEVLMAAGEGLGSEDVRELYAGFMGSMGNGKDKSEIGSWYLKNDFVPIDFGPYTYIDLSNVALAANPPAGEASSIITASVKSIGETPAEGIPLVFSTSFGTLESSSATTDASGNASVNLRSGIPGTASVKVVAPGGATALTQVQLAVSDEDRFLYDRAWLTEDIVLGENTSAGGITTDVHLPAAAPSGSRITWGSSSPAVIALDGTVRRPAFVETDQSVKLTATLEIGVYTETIVFDVTVKALASTDLEAVSLTEAWLTYDEILGDNPDEDHVAAPLSLMVAGIENAVITWRCSPEGILSMSPDTLGQVSPPSSIEGDAVVILTATIARGETVREKTFTVIVKAPIMTDEEAVAFDSNRLRIGDTLGLNPSPYAVTENLFFSDTSLYGSEIAYTSSAPDVLSLIAGGAGGFVGAVHRPGIGENNRSVTVTATVTRGSQEKVKVFEYTVVALRDVIPPVPVTIAPAHNSVDVAYNTKETVVTFDEDIMHKDGTSFYAYWPKYLNITLNGALMSNDYRVRFVGNQLKIINTAGLMPAGRNEIFIPAGAVKDKSGNAMAEDLTIVYTVEERIVRNIGLASSVPASGTVNVPVSTEISFTFDTPGLIKGSNFNSIALMSELYPSIPIQCEIADNKVTVSFKYAGWSLQKGKAYWLLIPGGAVQDRFLNQNAIQLLSFVVSPDTVKPTVVSTFPAQNETGVSVLQHIQVNYQDAVIRAGGQAHITDETGKPVAFALGELRDFDTIQDLIPLAPLAPNTRYTVVIPADFVKTKMAPHEPALSNHTFSFTTGEDGLAVQSVHPKNFALDIPVNDPVRLVFDRPVQRGPNQHLLRMTDSAGIDVGVFATYNGNAVEIKPLSLWLEPHETYTLMIPAGLAVDGEGNRNNGLTVTFTTGKKLDLSKGGSFTVHPSPRYLVNKKITFDTTALQETFRKTGRKLVSCQWDFGDRQTAAGLQAQHTYTSQGNYTAKLTATDSKGIEYELTQPMSIWPLDAENVEVIVTPEKLQNLIREDEYIDPLDGHPGRRIYRIYAKNEGIYLPDEKIKVYLYKNGTQIKDMGTFTTQYQENGVPVAYFPFDYKNPAYLGNYELVFVYGNASTPESVQTLRRTVHIADQRKQQDLWIQPVNALTGEVVDIYPHFEFEVDGIIHYGIKKQEGENVYYVIKDLPTGFHSLKLIRTEGWAHYSDAVDLWHTSTAEITVLPVQAVSPGISRVWAKLETGKGPVEISSNSKEYRTFIDIPGVPGPPPIRFNIDMDWNETRPGYFELQYNGWTERFYDPWFDFEPAGLYPGSKLFVRAVNPMGEASAWIDCKIDTAESPTNPYVWLTYVDGEYLAETDMFMPDNVAGKIEELDDMPLLDHSQSFGTQTGMNTAFGAIKVSNGKLYMDMSFDAAGSYGESKKKPKMVSVGYNVEGETGGRVYMIYDPAVGYWSMDAGEFYVRGDVSVYREKGKVIPVINLGAKGRITIGTGMGGTLYIDNAAGAAAQYSGILYLEPYVKGEVYGGIEGFNVEGYVKGSVNTEVHIPTGYIKVVPELTSKITNTVLFVTTTVFDETWSTSWNNGKDPVVPIKRLSLDNMTSALTEASASYEVIPRNYLLQDPSWTAASRGDIRFMASEDASSMDAADESALLKTSVYPYSDVKLVRKGDELVAVWTDDDPARTDLNRTRLHTSVKSGSVWSGETKLDDDGTADFMPAVTLAGADVLVAWQDFDGVFTEEDIDGGSLDTILKKAEISVMNLSDSLADSGSLTEDDYYDHSPVIASIGDRSALLVWVKSEKTSHLDLPQGGEATSRLMYSARDGADWSDATVLKEGMSLISDCSLIAGDDSYLLLYTLDSDNDVATPQDNEVWAIEYTVSTGAWSAPVPLTDNDVRDANAQGVFHRGDWFLLWNQEERYVYRQGLAGETLSAGSLEGVSGKTALTQGDAFIALVYQKGGDSNNRNLSALFYDIEKSSWSNEISLTDRPGYARSFSPAFDADGNLGLLYTHADIITEFIGETTYYSPSDHVDLMYGSYTPKHDLAMDRDGAIVLSADHPAPETAVRVTCLVENKGDFAERATVALYEGTSASGVKIGEQILAEPIPAGASVPVTMEWIVPEENKTEYKLYAEVVSTDEVAEVDPTNNAAYLTVYSSDVGLADVQWESLAGYQYLVKPLVFNEGSTPLENIEVVLAHNDTEVASTVLSALDPGEHATVSFVVSSESYLAGVTGKYPMTVTVSLPEDIRESTADNNVLDFELDTKILSVRAMNPADGQQQAGIDAPITLTFNRLIMEKDGFDDIKLTDSYFNAVPVTKTIDQNVLTIAAENPLRYSTQYTLSLPENAVGDAYGRSMKTAGSLSFTTVSQNPAPIFNTPLDQSTDVATDTEIRVQYSEAITAGSAFDGIYLEQSGSKLKIPAAVTVNEQWLTVKPLRVLSGNTAYAVHIPIGAVKNTNGDHQSVDYDFIFTTKEDHSSGSGAKPPAAEELSLTEMLVDSLSGSDWSMDQAGFYSLDLTRNANLADGVRLTLSYGVLDQLFAAGSGLRITTEKGELIFPAQWIRNLAKDEKGSVIVTIAARNENDREQPDDPDRISGLLSITVTVGGRPLNEFDELVTVVMQVRQEEIQNGQRVIACRYDEGTGTWVPLGGKADLDAGTITFRTGHFSDFAAFETVRGFADVTAVWAKEPVEILASRGLISGTKEGVFDPSRRITRAEFTAIVVRSLYGKPATEKGTFSDVALDAWYADAVETAAALGIMSGMGKDRFAPLESMTREQLATIAYRLINQMQNKAPQEEVEAYGFADQNEIAPYAADGVNYLASKGIMIGSFGAFDPKANLTRQEAAVVLYRLLEYVGEI